MAAITDYDSLVAELVATLVNSDIAAKAPRFIQFTEAEIRRRLLTIEDEVTATTATVAGDNTLAFPSRFKQVKSIKIGSDPTNILKQLSVDDLDAQWADASDAKPENFAITDGQFKLGPAPDAAYTATIVYIQGIAALSASNTTNWLLNDHPDAYFYGSLFHAEIDGWNDDRGRNLYELFNNEIDQIKAADAVRRKSDNVGEVAGCYF